MSPRELPLWARAAALALAVFASWWLVNTQVLRDVVGPSVAAVGLGVVAVFALRGMHLPLGIWPAGNGRAAFAPVWVVATGAAVAVLVLVGDPATSPALRALLDNGRSVLLVVGGLGWGYSLALIRQGPFLPWYGVALVLGAAPAAVQLMTAPAGDGLPCLWGGGAAAACVTGVAQAYVFTLAIAAPVALVTTELAFRRLLLGRTAGAGALLVVAGAVGAVVWYAVLASDPPDAGAVVWWLAGALTAGSVYVLSGSLLVSSLYVGALEAGLVASRVGAAPGLRPGLWGPALTAHVVVAVILLVVVGRRNGVRAGLTRRAALLELEED